MTLTVAESGTYLIIFAMAGTVDKATADNIICCFQLLINEDVITMCKLGGKDLLQLRGFTCFITVQSLNVDDVVKVQWKATYATTTCTCRCSTPLYGESRELTMIKLET